MRSSLFALPAVLTLTFPLAAQATSQRFDAPNIGDTLGRAVACVGDVDQDGADDFAVGADQTDATGRDSGAVYVYSGRTRAVLFTLQGDSIGDFFGAAVGGAGDVDADGVPDVVVGAYGDDPPLSLDLGAVYVFSGRTHAQLYKFSGVGIEDRMGYSVAGAGDVNADGFADVIGGAYTSDAAAVDGGQAVVWSGRDGSVLWTFSGTQSTQYLGWSVAGAGDVDRDGFSDVVVGAVGDAAGGVLAGTAIVYSGRTGAEIWRLNGNAADLQGAGVAGAGDVDLDGYDDILVGAPFADDGGVDFGSARLYSGRTGARIYTLVPVVPYTLFGYPVGAAGDLDGDGHPDMLVGAILSTPGVVPASGGVYVYSGATGSLITALSGEGIADGFGFSEVGCDVDDDGFNEIVVGAPFADNAGADSGSAYVFDLNNTGTPPRAWDFGKACLGSNGNSPHVGHRGRAALGEVLELNLRGAPPLSPVIVDIGLETNLDISSFGFTGCTFLATADGFVLVRFTDVDGRMDFDPITIPVVPSFVGSDFAVQWICYDPPVNAPGYAFSNATKFRFGN
ncbi:MAG: hypothetical protein U1F36_16340 [Planctomycetota bacterium]